MSTVCFLSQNRDKQGMFSSQLLLLEKQQQQNIFFQKNQNKRPLHKIAQSLTDAAVKGK